MPNTVKVSAEQWIEVAKAALVEEGLPGVKVDRLAKKLGVTRGGFYHNFSGQRDLLDKLIDHWGVNNEFVPSSVQAKTPGEALKALEELTAYLIQETTFSPAFELAVREWARVDKSVRKTVDKVDKVRLRRLTKLFSALGCDKAEAPIRARVFYFHQLGFYSLGYHERMSMRERAKDASTYLKILCGKRFLEAAESEMEKWS
nr:TetR/AcrR family transcriptional regulator [Hyphomonas sp. Mor2]